MASRHGLVIFTGSRSTLAEFYSALGGLRPGHVDDSVTVLESGDFEIVIHHLPGEPAGSPAAEREAYVKPFFRVDSIAEARQIAGQLGGRLAPAGEEWVGRGFRACEGVDPDGNPIQVREAIRVER